MSLSTPFVFFGSLILATGIATGGYFVGDGISQRGRGQHIISVKGLSEKEVPASIAIWTLSYSATGNDLNEINTRLSSSTQAVRSFLQRSGFSEQDIATQPPSISDLMLTERDKDEPPPAARFSASQSVLLRTTNVDAVKPAVATSSQLISEGVLLSGRNDPNYIFTELNEVKPAMIREATQNARIAADQFASDSQVSLGKLRTASQGWFQVDDRDAATPERKMVRVVVDVVYEVK